MSNYIDPPTARAIAETRRMLQEAMKTLNDITDSLGIDTTDNSDGLFDVADLAGENSDGIFDLAEMVADLEERVSALEG